MQCETNTCKTQDRTESTRTAATYRPLVDIVELKDELLLRIDLPGVKPDGVDIEFEDGTLTIQGRVAPRYDENFKFLAAEYGVGDFYRTFRVSEQIDPAKIHAEHAHGVLTVHLPKTEAVKPRKIEVRAV
jgi:HSP20 family protein